MLFFSPAAVFADAVSAGASLVAAVSVAAAVSVSAAVCAAAAVSAADWAWIWVLLLPQDLELLSSQLQRLLPRRRFNAESPGRAVSLVDLVSEVDFICF